jgi:hypothetical protein
MGRGRIGLSPVAQYNSTSLPTIQEIRPSAISQNKQYNVKKSRKMKRYNYIKKMNTVKPIIKTKKNIKATKNYMNTLVNQCKYKSNETKPEPNKKNYKPISILVAQPLNLHLSTIPVLQLLYTLPENNTNRH